MRKWLQVGFATLQEPPEPEVAEYSGTCPACHVFIAKNHSWVRRLPRPLAPQVEWHGGVAYSAVTGKMYHAQPPRMHPRWLVHEYCWNRAAKILDDPEYLAHQ